MFRLEYRVFIHTHPTPFLRSCLLLLGVGSPPSLVAYLTQLLRFELSRFLRYHVGNSPAPESLSVLPASSPDPGILCEPVSVGHQFESLPPFLVSTEFCRPTHVCRTPTRGGCVGRKHRLYRMLTFSHVFSLHNVGLLLYSYHRTRTFTASSWLLGLLTPHVNITALHHASKQTDLNPQSQQASGRRPTP